MVPHDQKTIHMIHIDITSIVIIKEQHICHNEKIKKILSIVMIIIMEYLSKKKQINDHHFTKKEIAKGLR